MKVRVVPPLGDLLKQQIVLPHHHVTGGGRTRVQERESLTSDPALTPDLVMSGSPPPPRPDPTSHQRVLNPEGWLIRPGSPPTPRILPPAVR